MEVPRSSWPNPRFNEIMKMASATSRIFVLEPGRADRHYWRDLWAYRELFAILAWRDVAVRYKQTVIGVAWALVRPFVTMVSSSRSCSTALLVCRAEALFLMPSWSFLVFCPGFCSPRS